MFRLSHVITLMTNAVLVGGLIVVFLSLGWVGWVPITLAVVVGFALSWPVARIVARRIKRADPSWNAEQDQPTPEARAARAAAKR